MTQNAWNSDYPNANGETLIGSGTGAPVSATITGGTNCAVVNSAGGIQLTYDGATTGDWVLTHSASASSSSELTFTSLSSTYFIYMMVVDNYQPSTDGQGLKWQTSSDNGTSYDSGSSDYYYRGWDVDTGGTINGLNANIAFSNFCGNGGEPPGSGTNETSSSITYFYNPSASDYTRATNYSAITVDDGDIGLVSVYSGRKEALAVDAIRAYCSTGNIATAEMRLYGWLAS